MAADRRLLLGCHVSCRVLQDFVLGQAFGPLRARQWQRPVVDPGRTAGCPTFRRLTLVRGTVCL